MPLFVACCVFINIFIVCQAKTAHVSRDQAGLECGSRGGMAPPAWFAGVPHTESYLGVVRTDVKTYDDFDNLNISDGESAWVGGYAEFGPGLAWYDCFQIASNITRQLKSVNTLYECATMCHNYTYIGIKDRRCICLQNSDFINAHAQCNDTRKGIFGVYQVNNRKQQALFQCNAIKYDMLGVYVDFSDKCSSKHMSLCVSGAAYLNDDCKDQYTRVSTAVSNCLVNESHPWSKDFEMCKRFNGQILSNADNQSWLVYLNDIIGVEHRTVWLGTFRTFRISDSQHLSVTRDGVHLLLEPADCSRELKFICTKDLMQAMGKQENVYKPPVNIPILIASIVSVVIVLVLVVVIYHTQCVCKLLQQMNVHRPETPQASNSVLQLMDAVHQYEVAPSNPQEHIYINSTAKDNTQDDVLHDVTCNQQLHVVAENEVSPSNTQEHIYNTAEDITQNDTSEQQHATYMNQPIVIMNQR